MGFGFLKNTKQAEETFQLQSFLGLNFF